MNSKFKRALNLVTPGLFNGQGLGDLLGNKVAGVDFSIGAESTNAIAVAVQLKNGGGENVAEKNLVNWWLSDTAAGAETGTGPATSTVISGGVSKRVKTAKISGEAVTSVTGAFIATLTETGADTWYLNVEVDGRIYSSGAITFAA